MTKAMAHLTKVEQSLFSHASASVSKLFILVDV